MQNGGRGIAREKERWSTAQRPGAVPDEWESQGAGKFAAAKLLRQMTAKRKIPFQRDNRH